MVAGLPATRDANLQTAMITVAAVQYQLKGQRHLHYACSRLISTNLEQICHQSNGTVQA